MDSPVECKETRETESPVGVRGRGRHEPIKEKGSF